MTVHPSIAPMLAGILILPGFAPDLAARGDPSALCIDAARAAAQATGVPERVLLAVTLVETGRDARPWPWTVNVGGEGHWFDTASEAEAHARSMLDRGLTNVDLGCFQLNLRWHSKGFASLADMLDPAANATYAAGFLAENFARTGDWAAAAAAYHSQTPEHAERYRANFGTAYAALDSGDIAPEDPEPRENRFPLLLAGARGMNGSLVPATGAGLRLIGGY